jgi:excisionase family DNA binding protein
MSKGDIAMYKRNVVHEIEPEALRMDEAAQLLGIGRSTLLKLTYEGIIPSIKIRDRRLWRRSDLDNWLASLPTAPINYDK